MDCCYTDECGEYAVSPVLMPGCYPKCESVPMCYPCLPHCPKVIYCCPPPRSPRKRECYYDYQPACYERCREHEHDRCCEHEHEPEHHHSPRCHRRPSTPPCHTPRSCGARSPTPCCSPSEPQCCKPVRTKYVIPCYRYEDGRINQPTLLMRRACEVAVGNRHRKKPFVVSSDYQDPYNEVHRYHSEDEKGNFCFHLERKKPMTGTEEPSGVQPILPSQPCSSCPQCTYTDSECVQAKPIDPKTCCYYCN